MKFLKELNGHTITLYLHEYSADTLKDTLILSKDEDTAANKFKFPHLKERYQFAHIKLRQALSEHLNIPPEEIKFHKGGHGKPYIPENQKYFNLSHSGNHVLIGITDTEIGVDIETHGNRGSMDIAKRFFAKPEYDHLTKIQPEHFQAEFYNIWTRKEAVIKCTGLGLSMGLDTFSVLEDKYENFVLYSEKLTHAYYAVCIKYSATKASN